MPPAASLLHRAVALAIAAAASHGAAPAHADELGLYNELTVGGVRGAPGDLADGEFGRRGGFGLRGARWGGELGLIGADFRGARGSYTALTAGATVTARRVLVRRPLDRVFEQRLEVHARLGPSYTWMYGDPGEGPPDGASGAGFTAGAGLRWTFGAVALAVDLGLVEVRARRAAVFAPRDERPGLRAVRAEGTRDASTERISDKHDPCDGPAQRCRASWQPQPPAASSQSYQRSNQMARSTRMAG